MLPLLSTQLEMAMDMKALAPVVMVVGGLLSLAWISGWFYVAYHFIVKYW